MRFFNCGLLCMTETTPAFKAKTSNESFEFDNRTFENFLNNKNFENLVTELLQKLEKELRAQLTKYPDAKIVIGGKSRLIVKLFLNKIASELSENDPLKKLLKERLELNDLENRNLYGETTTPQIIESGNSDETVSVIPPKIDTNSHLIFIDDHAYLMTKAKKIFMTLNEAHIPMSFVAFTGITGRKQPGQPDSELTQTNRFIAFPDQPDDIITVVAADDILFSFLSRFSRRLSYLVDIRLNQTEYFNGSADTFQFDKSDTRFKQNYQQFQKLLAKFQNIINGVVLHETKV